MISILLPPRSIPKASVMATAYGKRPAAPERNHRRHWLLTEAGEAIDHARAEQGGMRLSHRSSLPSPPGHTMLVYLVRQLVGERAPAQAPSAFGLDCLTRHAAVLEQLP